MAVDISTQQMALCRDTGPGGFMERIAAMLGVVATQILQEPGATPFHSQRAEYAQRVTQQPITAAQTAAPQIVMGVNIINTTVYVDLLRASYCTAADIDLQSQISTLWNTLAGIDEGAIP